jgi:hypothetical protein
MNYNGYAPKAKYQVWYETIKVLSDDNKAFHPLLPMLYSIFKLRLNVSDVTVTLNKAKVYIYVSASPSAGSLSVSIRQGSVEIASNDKSCLQKYAKAFKTALEDRYNRQVVAMTINDNRIFLC